MESDVTELIEGLPELPSTSLDAAKSALETPVAPTSEEHEEFQEWFSRDRITSRERVKKTRYTITDFCETDIGRPIYLTTFDVDDPRKYEKKVWKRKIGYKLCRSFNIPTVPHTFSDKWAASVAFEGEYNSTRLVEPDIIDDVLTELAKLALTYNWDLWEDILVTDDGDRAHIDVTPRFMGGSAGLYRLIGSASSLLIMKANYPPEILDILMRRIRDIAIYLSHHMEDFIKESWFRHPHYNYYIRSIPYVAGRLPMTHENPQHSAPPSYDWLRPTGHLEEMDNHWDDVADYIVREERSPSISERNGNFS